MVYTMCIKCAKYSSDYICILNHEIRYTRNCKYFEKITIWKTFKSIFRKGVSK